MNSYCCHACEMSGLSSVDYYHDDPRISACVEAMMLPANPWANPSHPPPSIEDIVATITKLYGKRAARGVYIPVH